MLDPNILGPVSRADFEEAKRLLRLMDELEAHEGWRYVRQRLLEAARGRAHSAAQTAETFDQLVARQGTAGELAGIELALKMPDAVREAAETVIAAWKVTEEKDDDE